MVYHIPRWRKLFYSQFLYWDYLSSWLTLSRKNWFRFGERSNSNWGNIETYFDFFLIVAYSPKPFDFTNNFPNPNVIKSNFKQFHNFSLSKIVYHQYFFQYFFYYFYLQSNSWKLLCLHACIYVKDHYRSCMVSSDISWISCKRCLWTLCWKSGYLEDSFKSNIQYF